MNTAIETQPLVIVHDPIAEPSVSVAAQLLGELGRRVRRARSIEDAINVVAESGAELMVLSCSNPAEHGPLLDRLAMLPLAHRPKHVAILSDNVDADNSGDPFLHRKLAGSKLHLFFRPLQALGLLMVAKQIAGEQPQHN